MVSYFAEIQIPADFGVILFKSKVSISIKAGFNVAKVADIYFEGLSQFCIFTISAILYAFLVFMI